VEEEMRKPAVIALMCALLVAASAAAATRSDGSRPAPPVVLSGVSSVPQSTFDAIGLGRVYPKSQFPLTRLGGTTPPVGGVKRVILAAIAEWCPHCIASSWVLALTLERFGTLTGLRTINSGTYYAKHGGKPAFSHTHGLSFIDAMYTSQYLRFDPIILYAKNGKPLEHATTAEKHKLSTFHARGSFPALDLAGAFGVVGLDFSPGILAGLSPTQIAGELADPTSAVAPYIDGEANLLTAALCVATGQQPAAVCDSPGVTTAATRLPPA
jgi:hypothetical protein